MEKIGFVGTGAMGSALLSRLKLANVSAVAFDIAPAGQEADQRHEHPARDEAEGCRASEGIAGRGQGRKGEDHVDDAEGGE